MKIMENVEMVHLKMVRDAVYDDFKEIDIAVEMAPYWNDEDYEIWKEDLLKSVAERFNQYGYWTEIIISEQYIDDGKVRIYEIGRI